MLDSRMNRTAEKRRNVTARAFVTFPQMLSGALCLAMCSCADTRATPNDFASGRCGRPGDCHRFCTERAVAHKLRQLHASRETSASFGAFHFHSPSFVCREPGPPTI